MHEKSDPRGSGSLVETTDNLDQANIGETVALYKPEHDHPTTFATTLRPTISTGWMAYEAALFVQTLHDADGFVRFLLLSGNRPRDPHVPVVDAARAARGYAGQSDVYVSLGAYRYPRGPLAGIRTLHVDLDFYKVPPWRLAEPRDVLSAVLETLDCAKIPSPSLAVSSGRGLQLIWPVPPVKLRARPKAIRAMRELVKLLAPFGADPACTDLARVFRLPGTINSKNGAVARLLLCEPHHHHDFDGLCLAILGPKPEARATRRRPKTARDHKAENRSLVHRRLADLQQLTFGRWRGKVPEGSRNIVAHLAAIHLVQLAGDPFEAVAAWCAKWVAELPDGEVRAIVRSALGNKTKRGGYRYGGLTIGQRLDVTVEEVQRLQLVTIYAATDTPEEIKRRKRARDADAKRQKRRAAGSRPQAESARRLKPWETLGISRASYYRQQTRNTGETISAPLHSVFSKAPLQREIEGAPRPDRLAEDRL